MTDNRNSAINFNTDQLCFVDPATGRVHTWAQFVADLACPPAGGDSDSAYASICQLVSNIIRGDDFCIEEGSLPTTTGNFKSEISNSDDWLQAIRGSTSQIQLKTSGTTGEPKQVVHSVESLTRGVRTGKNHQNDVWGLAYPLNHLAGLQVLFQALFNQNTIVQLFGLPTESVHQAIEQNGITHLSCTPTFLKLLAAGDHSHLRVRRLTTGGERSDSATLSAVKRLFPAARHRNVYALTEVGSLLIADGDQFTVPADLQSLVKVIDGSLAIHRSLLADPSMTPAGDGLPTDTKSTDPNSKSHPQPDTRSPIAETRNPHPDWFLTGDLVEVLAEQPLTFKFAARRDDVINVGGYKVIPQQIEEQLLQIPQIQQAVVFGKKNAVTGQIVVCDVVLEPGWQLDPAETKQQLSQVLPDYAVPRIINIVESLRLTETGKLCRRSETS